MYTTKLRPKLSFFITYTLVNRMIVRVPKIKKEKGKFSKLKMKYKL